MENKRVVLQSLTEGMSAGLYHLSVVLLLRAKC